jgi:hypothetical protein
MKRLLNEPLLHFLLIGAGLFLVYSLISKPGADAPGSIVVTSGQVERLATTFTKTWQRPPTEAEMKGLIDEWVREEIATREAIALGLDRDDSVIRRRLRQKLEFVAADLAAQTEPTDADLNAYLQAHPEKFREELRYTFEQIYLDPTKHGANLTKDATALLAKLKQSGEKVDPKTLGDPFLLENQFSDASGRDIGTQFGQSFATKFAQLTSGAWQGPIESGYGLHLVFIHERTPGKLPSLADVRAIVRREWSDARRVDAKIRFYDELLKRYTVTIEPPKPTMPPKTVAMKGAETP